MLSTSHFDARGKNTEAGRRSGNWSFYYLIYDNDRNYQDANALDLHRCHKKLMSHFLLDIVANGNYNFFIFQRDFQGPLKIKWHFYCPCLFDGHVSVLFSFWYLAFVSVGMCVGVEWWDCWWFTEFDLIRANFTSFQYELWANNLPFPNFYTNPTLNPSNQKVSALLVPPDDENLISECNESANQDKNAI